MTPKHFVYAMTLMMEDNGPYLKIGYSANPIRRLAEIKNQNKNYSVELKAVRGFESKVDALEHERYSLRLLKNHRVIGDYFEYNARSDESLDWLFDEDSII